MKKLTQEEFKERVKECVGDKYSVVGEYKGKFKPILMHCNIHNIDFSVSAECFMRGPNDIRGSCPQCHAEKIEEQKKDTHLDVECAYCGKNFSKRKSRLENSKSGLYFCCREHKDIAQRIGSGERFNELRPPHYDKGDLINYRLLAFRNYPHECSVCGYHDDDDISLLEVHHIDEDRENNKLENLIILCPNCHRKLTSQKYILVNRQEIIKKNDYNPE